MAGKPCGIRKRMNIHQITNTKYRIMVVIILGLFIMSFCSADVKEHAPMWMGTTYKITVREQI